MGDRGSESGIRIVEAIGVDDALVSVMARLVPQLSRSNPPPDAATLEAIVGSEASVLLLALDEEPTDNPDQLVAEVEDFLRNQPGA